jgi:hypothetical protein
MVKKFKPDSKYSFKLMLLWVGVFAAIGVTTLLLTRAATPGIAVIVDSSLPDPTNVKTYVDDRATTVTWDKPSNADSKGIVGYYVTWGAQSSGVYTNAKQTTYTVTQIQPLANGTVYNVKVQSVQGNEVRVPTPDAHDPVDYGSDPHADEYRANGKVSPGATTTITPSSARVDQLRTQMTGFFDDFNTPAGELDPLRWNSAASACAHLNGTGSFVNNQFHAHTQGRSSISPQYCDRGQTVNRTRSLFDVTGRTEANPGVLTYDFDGVTHSRDVWYIDLIPDGARLNGVPLDITSHSSVFNDSVTDPSLLRFVQENGQFRFTYYDANKVPQSITPSYLRCSTWDGNASMNYCDTAGKATAGLSPLPEMPFGNNGDKIMNIPNVRQHWRMEVSPTKIKVFLNSVVLYEAPMPSIFANVKKYQPEVVLFTYNTGKDDATNPTTSILHWDNFGFNGSAPTTVVHDYMEGGPTGTTPYLGKGTAQNPVPNGTRTTKVNIPDSLGSPLQARVMFTIQNFGYQTYNWKSTDYITVNGHKYNVPDPATIEKAPVVLDNAGLAWTYTAFAQGIPVNVADLKQGMNDIALMASGSGSGADFLNVHVELEYTKGSEPTYTTPTNVFGASALLAAIQPTMAAHDSYLFVEQDLGLPSGALDSTPPVDPPPTGGDTTKPTVSLTAPSNNVSVAAGSSFTASASASDNVGVTKVEFYLGNTLKATDTSSPYSTSVSTVGLTPGNYSVTAMAYDAAGNSAVSPGITIVIPQPPDTTAPSVVLSTPSNGATLSGANITMLATAGDGSGISKVEFYIDSKLIGTDTSDPYSATLDSTKETNGTHNLTAKAYDTAGNIGTSAAVGITVNNAVADTTPPTVAISAPVANATISGVLAFIQATASDNVAMSKVEFYIDGVLLGTDNLAPFSFSLNTTLYTNANHALTAKAFDSSNNSTTSSAVTVRVNNIPADTTPPSIIITSPLNGVTISGSTYNAAATVSDANGVSKVEFSVDGTLKSTKTSTPYSYTLDTTSLSNASHTISVRGYDTNGNNQAATANFTVDNTPVTPPAKNCDFTGDGHVDLKDLVILLQNYGKTVTAGKNGDCTSDGKVDLKDLIALLGVYGS